MTLEMRRVCEGDHQAEILLGPVTKICHYLEEALESPLSLQYIPLPRFFNIDAPHLEEEEEEHTGEKSKLEKESEAVLGIEVPGPSGFLSLSQGNLADYEHSALTITAIARFHAGSYCYQRIHGGLECVEECPMEPLPVINSQSLERFSRLLKSTPAYCQYHQLLLGALQGDGCLLKDDPALECSATEGWSRTIFTSLTAKLDLMLS